MDGNSKIIKKSIFIIIVALLIVIGAIKNNNISDWQSAFQLQQMNTALGGSNAKVEQNRLIEFIHKIVESGWTKG